MREPGAGCAATSNERFRRKGEVEGGETDVSEAAAKNEATSTPSANNTRCTLTLPVSSDASEEPTRRSVPSASQLMPVGERMRTVHVDAFTSKRIGPWP